MAISSCSSLNLFLSPLSPASKYQSGLLPPFSASRSSDRSLKKAPSLHCRAQLLSDLAPATSAAYGALLLGGGVFAYVRSGSKGSVVGGLSGAALMGTAYYLMQSPETKVIGDALGFGSAFLFSAVFGISRTRNFVSTSGRQELSSSHVDTSLVCCRVTAEQAAEALRIGLDQGLERLAAAA